ncbi:type II toxin-antitoxin system MqsA family antitoxin [Methylobacter svalbardensis]|uniref:type II toxin-antitoxin system MqsA family antitoxin n=1 Tax=Methylobacter svalbardensis TaxID=3080016 RepID=UPI0030ED62CA
MNNILCVDCGTEALQSMTENEEFNYKGHTLSVDVEYSVCSQCGAEAILPEQIKRNDCRTRDAWRNADGLLTGVEIVALRKQLDLTQQQAAQMFGGGVNAFSKYERGAVIQSVAMDNLMRLALEKQPVDVGRWLIEHSGLDITKPKTEYSKVVRLHSKSKQIVNVHAPTQAKAMEPNFADAEQ